MTADTCVGWPNYIEYADSSDSNTADTECMIPVIGWNQNSIEIDLESLVCISSDE